jgi:protein required for attachment to host cells
MLRKITPKTWVLVADGAHAKIFVGAKKGLRLHETPKETFDATRERSRELGTDRQGRMSTPAMGGQRNAIDWRTDPRRYVEQTFIKSVAEHVEAAVKSGEVNQVVLVAAPRALGDLRNALGDHARAKVVAEVDRELVNEPAETIRDYVLEAMRAA